MFRGRKDEEACKRFKLNSGQFFGTYRYKNLWWELDDKIIGFGDLRDDDIVRIQETLTEGEEFVGWHEAHDSKFQQTDLPMIKITKDGWKLRGEICAEAKEETKRA